MVAVARLWMACDGTGVGRRPRGVELATSVTVAEAVGSWGRTYVPGLAVLVAVALASHLVAGFVPGLNALVLAILTGAVVGNLVDLPATIQSGIDTHGLLLEIGIVLLGASLSLSAIVDAGLTIVLLVLGVVAFGLVFVTLAARGVGVRRQTASLLAAGSSICGVSAVAAAAGVVDADEADIAYAAGTVLLFDAVTLVVFPVAGQFLGLSQRAFGVWAGLSMFSTGPVTAAGFAYGPVAGRWATLTKLVRNTLIGVVAVVYSVIYGDAASDGIELRRMWTEFPKFLVGFLVVAAIANTGVLGQASLDLVGRISDWLFLVAFAGLGFDIRFDRMRSTGLTPVGIVFLALLATSALAYFGVRLVGL